MQQCPTCQSDDIQRSRSRSWWEQWRKEITEKRPYRCGSCGWRGWGFDTGPKASATESQFLHDQADPPNLKSNSLLGSGTRRQPVSLATLDVLERGYVDVTPTPGKPR